MSEQKVWNIMACEMNYETWEESAISFVSSIFFSFSEWATKQI